jgi:hypothetical protein
MHDPVIIIGAGRSGSTLVHNALDAHPDIAMRSEANFMLAHLWKHLWTEPSQNFYDWHVYQTLRERDAGLTPGEFVRRREAGDEAVESLRARKRDETITLVRQTFMAAVGTAGSRWWGFKEIWNGHRSHRHDWAVYRDVFPGAVWVQSVRHPFEFVRSLADRGDEAFTFDYLAYNLIDWVQMVERSRELTSSGRYHEFRMEDFLATPDTILRPVLDLIGCPWSDRCIDAADTQYYGEAYREPTHSPWPAGDAGRLLETPGLKPLMDELGYELPEAYRS